MKEEGYNVENTNGDDLDLFPVNHETENFDAITAFEILEHLISPFQLLKNIKCKRLYATVPLNLWYSKAYRNYNDIRDSHFHEFEDRQFDWLLQKSGWKIIKKEYWKNPSKKIGFRPLLRNFTNRYYAVYAERSMENYTNYYRYMMSPIHHQYIIFLNKSSDIALNDKKWIILSTNSALNNG